MFSCRKIAMFSMVLLSISAFSRNTLSKNSFSAASVTKKVMLLGNSLTYDDFTGDLRPAGLRTGYRQPLWLALQEYGYTIDFVGSRRAGFDAVPAFDPDNEGHPGYTAAQVADSVYHWLTLNPAEFILLEIGTNGLQSSPADVERILNETDRFEQDNSVQITVILSRIINRSTYSSLTTQFNNNVESMANTRISNGDKIVIVDMENGAGIDYRLEPDGDMRDNLHPNQNGYNKMAVIWFNSLLTVLPVQTPNLPNAPANLSATANLNGTISLAWTDQSRIENGYYVERKDSPSGAFTLKATLAKNSSSFTDGSVVSGTTYSYRVRCFNAGGNSSYTNTASATALNNTLGNGLVAQYTFENSGNDVSGNGHTGTLVNGATYSASHKEGSSSLSLDGVNDYVDIGTINLGTQFSIATWVYIPSGYSNLRTIVANAGSGAATNGFRLMVNTYGTTDQKIILETGNGSQAAHAETPVSTFVFNGWNHVAVVADQTTGQARIYFNGSDVTSASSMAANFATNQTIRLGQMTNGVASMPGNLDDTRFYNRLLTASEIVTLANPGAVVTIPNAPGGLTATAGTTSINLAWSDNSSNEDGFRVERSLSSGSGFSLVYTSAPNVSAYSDGGVTAGTPYYYRVKAFNSAGESAYSNVASALLPATPPPGGLIAQYTFENSGNDVSGNGHTGTLVNGATYSASHKEGSASLSLDGVNDYVDIGTINLGTQFSIATWVYIPSGYSNLRTIVANAGSGAATNGFRLMVNTYGTTDQKIILETGNGSQAAHAETPVSTFVFNGWNHVAVVADQTTGQARIYFNGSDVTSASSMAANFATNQTIRLGQMTNGVASMPGNLDDTRFYNRLLTASEIVTLANPGAVVTIPNAPGGLTATAGTTSINLAWSDNSSNEDGFRVERSLSSGSGFSLVYTSAPNVSAYSDGGVTAGTPYYYRVKAFNSAGESAYSNVASALLPATPPPGGLIAQYTFENSGNDVSGNGHTGTLVNGATYSASHKEGSSSLSLDGVNEYVDIGTINLGTQFSIATWVYIPSGYSNLRTIVANAGSGAATNGFRLMVNTYGTTDQKIILETGNGSQAAHAETPVSTFVFNGWNHVAVVADQTTGQARIYFNGSDVTSASSMAANFATNQTIRLGQMTNGVASMPGNLDDTRFYNRLLTASEIANLYSALKTTATGDMPEESPAAPENNKLLVFPNPFTDHLEIQTTVKIKDVQVYNLLGNKVYEQFNINSNDFILDKFDDASTLYFIRLNLENNESHVVKVFRNP